MAKQWHQLERLDHKALKKLQAEREKAAKLAAQKEAHQKQMIIGGIVLVVFCAFVALTAVIKKKADANALEAAKEKLLYTNIVEFTGTPDYKTSGDWRSLNKNLEFKEVHTFRTSDESSITIKTQLDNEIKMYSTKEYPSTEITVKPPLIENKEAKIIKQNVEMTKGDVKVSISVDGKQLLHILVGNITVVGQAGLFKIRYDDDKDKGEVVVKNGLVEVSVTGSRDKPIKLSGFYKVTFENGELSAPTQASVIQYDWR